ncbi:arginine repressor [Spirochaeta isovalerica]|uniref:Arginine repressor n=1 Tax=Spirochaeta isovalerica TaxID=150 RepID=A0A841RHL2_9SPIO|nr:arginine repressor [Spirochaeta isovalerica]MBB6482500.1 transcriptional regulator of arginine metabolism [Spirochaeta isovalerica]
MNDRRTRLVQIKKIIRENHVSSQEQLLKLLDENGISVTQATLSRDLKMLNVSKISNEKDGYHYHLPSEKEEKEAEKYLVEDIARGFLSIEFSGNLAILKTLPGHANTVAIALDKLEGLPIIGTIAGDDAILIVLKENEREETVIEALVSRIPDLEHEL